MIKIWLGLAWYTLIPSCSCAGFATGAGFAMFAFGWCWYCDLLVATPPKTKKALISALVRFTNISLLEMV